MTLEAKFVHGTSNVRMVDYTPSGAVTGGEVVVVGDLPLIAHRDIAASEQGAMAAGGGVYECVCDGALSAGVVVYWVAADGEVSATKGSNKRFGYLEADSSSSADQDIVRVIHDPGTDLTA